MNRIVPDLLRRYLPILAWGAEYSRRTLVNDLTAAAIVTIMLIPQSLAYALLVGLPAQVGLYASMAPLVLYAIFGTSRALAVGPVAVASLMTAAAAGQVAAQGTPEYLGAAIALAMVAGLMLVAMGALRLGFLANFLSHPVISGFITAAAVQIAAGQVAPLLGIRAHGENLLDLLISLVPNLVKTNPYTAVIGLASLVFLLWVRRGLKPLLLRVGLGEKPADFLAKMGPAMAIVVTIAAVWGFRLDARGVGILGAVPQNLPELALPPFNPALWTTIIGPALLICIVGYVESISVALTLAAKRRQRVDPDQELIALGASNIGAAVSGGFPVTGALSRSVVNFEAGAQTPAAGAFTAVGVALATVFLTPLLFFLPKAVLGAIIIVAVLSLVDLGALKRTWNYSRADFAAMAATILVTWAEGVEAGLVVGVALSIFLHLYAHIEAARGGRGPDPGDRAFPQRDAPHRGDRPRDPVAPGGREPLFPERPFPRGPDQRGGRGQPGDPPRHPRMPRGEHDRRLGPREPRGDQPPAQGRRDHAPPLRGEGPDHGPPEAVAFPGRADRQGPPDPIRSRVQHQPRTGAPHAGGKKRR